MMFFLRWLLVPVSAALVVAVVIYTGIFAVGIADQNCAADSFAAGSCVASWHTTALETIIYAGVVITAIGQFCPAFLAPASKRESPITNITGPITTGVKMRLSKPTSWVNPRPI